MKPKQLKAYQFIFCWLFTLLIGIIFTAPFFGGFALLTAIIAGLTSLPFIILFTIIMAAVIKKKPSKQSLHIYTLVAHLTGSILVFAGFWILGEIRVLGDAGALAAVMACYFAVDSALFHFIITRRYSSQADSRTYMKDILDSEL